MRSTSLSLPYFNISSNVTKLSSDCPPIERNNNVNRNIDLQFYTRANPRLFFYLWRYRCKILSRKQTSLFTVIETKMNIRGYQDVDSIFRIYVRSAGGFRHSHAELCQMALDN